MYVVDRDAPGKIKTYPRKKMPHALRCVDLCPKNK
jgi:hypothetical protein